MHRFFATAALGVLLGAPWPGPARADTEACTPFFAGTIDSPGHYCLREDHLYDGSAASPYTIVSDDVVFDCNRHVLRKQPGMLPTTAVLVKGGRQNVTVRNCVIDGYATGIELIASTAPGARANVIADNEIINGTSVGIAVTGSNNRIERNRIAHLRPSVVGYGISLISTNATDVGNIIRDNQVIDLRTASNGGGYIAGKPYPAGINFRTRGTEVTGNLVVGVYSATGYPNAGISGRIGGGGANPTNIAGSLVADNQVLAGPALGAPFDGPHLYGIVLDNATSPATDLVCRDNIVGSFATEISGCVQDGNTIFSPGP
jgi:hypothetical protein